MDKNKTLQLLRDGYKAQFAEFVFESEAYVDLVMELSYDFVNKELIHFSMMDNQRFQCLQGSRVCSVVWS